MILKRILIVDNSEIQCRALSRAFQKIKAITLVAGTGAEGVAQASLNQPDVIVLDLLLPDMDGFEVCDQLKRDAQTQPIPVVLFTGRTRVVDVMRGFAAGADMFIGKGLSYDKLIHCVGAFLAKQTGNGAEVDHQLVIKTCRELLESLCAAFDSVVRSRMEISLGTNAAAAVFQQATEKLPAGWKMQALREGAYDYLAVREAVVEFDILVSEVFGILGTMADSIEVGHLKDAFEQQLILLD